MNGAQSEAVLENFVVSEIMKGYHNSGIEPYFIILGIKTTKKSICFGKLTARSIHLKSKKQPIQTIILSKHFDSLKRAVKK